MAADRPRKYPVGRFTLSTSKQCSQVVSPWMLAITCRQQMAYHSDKHLVTDCYPPINVSDSHKRFMFSIAKLYLQIWRKKTCMHTHTVYGWRQEGKAHRTSSDLAVCSISVMIIVEWAIIDHGWYVRVVMLGHRRNRESLQQFIKLCGRCTSLTEWAPL